MASAQSIKYSAEELQLISNVLMSTLDHGIGRRGSGVEYFINRWSPGVFTPKGLHKSLHRSKNTTLFFVFFQTGSSYHNIKLLDELAEDHIEFRCCQPKTGISGYSGHSLRN